MQDIQRLEIDIDLKQNLLITATCKQLDNLDLIFNIWDNGQVANLNNYTCRLKALKSDQVPLIQNTDIIISNNVVQIKGNQQLTTTSGTNKTELQFIDKETGEKKSTFNLDLRVMPSVLEIDRSISKATCTLLEELDKKLYEIEDIKLNIEEGKEVNNALKTTITNANDMNNTLKTTISNTDNKKKEVENVINNASNKIKEVQDTISTANTTKQAVDNSVLQADNSKQALDTSKSNADNTKVQVDNSIIEANEKIEAIKKLDPNNVLTDVTDLKREVTGARGTYNDLNTRIDNIQARDGVIVYSGDEKPTHDGVWFDTSDDLEKVEGNSVIKEIKNYINTTVKVDVDKNTKDIETNTSQLKDCAKNIDNIKDGTLPVGVIKQHELDKDKDMNDLDIFKIGKMVSLYYQEKTNQTQLHTPYGYLKNGYDAITWYNVITFGVGERITQIATSAFTHNRNTFIRYKHDDDWSKWQQLATTEITEIGLLNGWQDYGSGRETLKAVKIGNIVSLFGIVKGGTGIIAYLPEGFRPITHNECAGISNGSFRSIGVGANGSILPLGGDNIWISLNGVSFITY